MKLMMYLGNDLIESIPLHNDCIPKPGYVGTIKRNLKEKHKDLIKQCDRAPEFLVIEPTKVETHNARNNKS